MASPRRYRRDFAVVAERVAGRLGWQVADDGALVGSKGRFRVEVSVESVGSEMGGSETRTRFAVALPGWPTESGLVLRPIRSFAATAGLPVPALIPPWRRWPVIRDRYVHFDDPDWDDAYIVQGSDPDTVRLHLDGRRRAAIAAQASRLRAAFEQRGDWRTNGWQRHCRIENGRLLTTFAGAVPSADRVLEIIDDGVDLAGVLT